MQEPEEGKICRVCSAFEPQTWRKSLCKNCFHSLDEHSEELLANEAKAVAKENAAAKGSLPATEETSQPLGQKSDALSTKGIPPVGGKDAKSKDGAKETKDEKDKLAKDVKGKSGGTKDSGKENSKWPLVKDFGRDVSKSVKPPTPTPAKLSKGKPPTPSTTSVSSSAPVTSAKSLKSTAPSAATDVITTPTTTPTTTTLTTAVTSPSASDTVSTASTQKASVSKTKNFASKFEAKASALSKDKPSKSFDSGSSNTSTASTNGKCASDSSDSKHSLKQQPEKPADQPKASLQKTDPISPRKTTEDAKAAEPTSRVPKPGLSKANGGKVDKDGVDNQKDVKSSLFSSKPKDKDTKSTISSRNKAITFGKDMLKSTKEVAKQEKTSPESADSKSDSSKAKDETKPRGKDSLKSGSPLVSVSSISEKDKPAANLKSVLGKTEEDKDKKQEDKPNEGNASKSKVPAVSTNIPESKTATGPSRFSGNSEPAGTGYLVKGKGKLFDSKAGDGLESKEAAKLSKSNKKESSPTKDSTKVDKNSKKESSPLPDSTKVDKNKKESSPLSDSAKTEKDKSPFSRDRGKDKTESVATDKKTDKLASLVGAKQSSPTLASSSSKPTTPTTVTSPSTESRPWASLSHSKTAENKKPKDLKLDTSKDTKTPQSPLEKFRTLEKTKEKRADTEASSPASVKSPTSHAYKTKDEFKDDTKKSAEDAKDSTKLTSELKEKEEKLLTLSKQVSKMEEQVRILEEERDELKRVTQDNQKEDMERVLNDLRAQLSKMEAQCSLLEKDNQEFLDKLHLQEASVKRDQECRGKNSENVHLEEDLEAAEKELEEVKDVNTDLQRQIMEMKNEMDEMYDHFRASEQEEFREMQKELEMTAKNCRILQFKLRKAERRNEQIEEDRIHYEEKLRMLQDQFDSKDAKNHIRVLEEELRIAKEVSVRLHDELDIVEDKRNKALDDNRHLTELLEHTDKRQFRLEMEIDKLRDIVADLKQQLKEARSGNNNNNNKDSTPDRKVLSTIYTRSID